MSWTTRAFSRAGALALCSALLGLFCAVANAATISYGDFNAPPSTMFLDVEESSNSSPVALYGEPKPFETGLDFTPKNFVALSAGAVPPKQVDGQLNFTVMSPGLQSLSVFEAGDYSLIGAGTPLTSVLASASIRATVTQINGVNVAPMFLTPSSASFGANIVTNPGGLQPWSLSTTIDIASQLGAGQLATKVDIAIDNFLSATSEATSAAFIAKKEFIVNGEIVPEPATLGLAGLALCGAVLAGGRRRG